MKITKKHFYLIRLALKYPSDTVNYIKRKQFYKVLGVSKDDLEKVYSELSSKKELLSHMNKEFMMVNLWNPDVFRSRQVELYVIVRVCRPEIVVETGVENGISSAFILEALNDNNSGNLYSIEILERLSNGQSSGWLVPDDLRKRWRLLIGDSLKILPSLLSRIVDVDMFIHDSEHIFETMSSEFMLAWPHLKHGGLLLSDDTGENEAFIHFCKKVGHSPLWTEKGYGLIKKIIEGHTKHSSNLRCISS